MAPAGQARWFWLSLAVLIADRATKLAIENSTPAGFHRVLVPGILTLVHSENPGIAFGLLSDSPSRWLTALLVLSAAVIVLLLVWALATGRGGGRLGHTGLALILGGAVGNLLDRLLHGGVTDFLEVRLGSYRWPAFNVADAAITIGAALVVIELLRERQHLPREST